MNKHNRTTNALLASSLLGLAATMSTHAAETSLDRIAEHTYMIQLMGSPLLDALCA